MRTAYKYSYCRDFSPGRALTAAFGMALVAAVITTAVLGMAHGVSL